MGGGTKGVIAVIKGVILIGVGRNLNRAIRTCYSFGVYDIYCFNCSGLIHGNLFSATGQVRLHQLSDLESLPVDKILALEVVKGQPLLHEYPIQGIEYLAIGGESITLKRSNFPNMARIPTANALCLTTEAALAIALYDLMGRV